MSSHLTWKPVHAGEQNLSSELKFILRERYGEPINHIIGEKDLDFLLGVRSAGSKEIGKEVSELIGAISRHGEIELKEQY